MRALSIFLTSGGVAAVAAAFLGYRKAAATKKTVVDAVAGADDATKAKVAAATTPAALQDAVAAAAPPAPPDVAQAAAAGDKAAVTGSSWFTGAVKLKLTGYWPSTAKASEKKLEGGNTDRKGKPLHTVEDYLAGKAEHVSLSGDDAIWPYGQAVMIPWEAGKTLKGRVTDTGGHFRGAGKVYRVTGAEPIDIDVHSSKTRVPSDPVVAMIDKGNTLDKPGKEVAVEKFQGQTVTVGARRLRAVGALHMLGAV